MKNCFNKSYEFLSLFSLFNIEKYLPELINLSFEYSSDFIFSYTMQDFKGIPLSIPNIINKEDKFVIFFLYLLNSYLEKDPFYNLIYAYICCKFKIKFNQFMQIMGIRGRSSIKNYENILFSNLNYGLSLKDFILTSFKTRESIIDSSVNIYSSGYLTRKLVEGLRNIHIKEIKCNTQYNCKNIINNTLITTPFLCFNNKSICAFCLNVKCFFNTLIGFNKGVVSGQALGEPSTQMLLRTFHLGADVVKPSSLLSEADKKIYDYKIYKFYSNTCYIKFFILLNKINNNNSITTIYPFNNCYYDKFNSYNNLNKIIFDFDTKFIILFNNFNMLWCLAKFYKNIYKFNDKNVICKSNNHNCITYKY